MRTYKIFTIISFIIWILAFVNEITTVKTFTVNVVFYLVMVFWAGFTIIKEENGEILNNL